ncbi:MAG: hypothetical protein ACPGJV_09380 [Bacteriovoracaceae bacterium]
MKSLRSVLIASSLLTSVQAFSAYTCKQKVFDSKIQFWNEKYERRQKIVQFEDTLSELETGDLIIFVNPKTEAEPSSLDNVIGRLSSGYSHVAMVYRSSNNQVHLMDSKGASLLNMDLTQDEIKKFETEIESRGGFAGGLSGSGKSYQQFLLSYILSDPELKTELYDGRFEDESFKARVFNTSSYGSGYHLNQGLKDSKYHILRLRRELNNRSQLLGSLSQALQNFAFNNITFDTGMVELYAYENLMGNFGKTLSDQSVEELKKSYTPGKPLFKHCTERIIDALALAGLDKRFPANFVTDAYFEAVEEIKDSYSRRKANDFIKTLNARLLIYFTKAIGNKSGTWEGIDKKAINQMEIDELNKVKDDFLRSMNFAEKAQFMTIQSLLDNPNRAAFDQLTRMYFAKNGESFFPKEFMKDAAKKSTYSSHNLDGGIFHYVGSNGFCKD